MTPEATSPWSSKQRPIFQQTRLKKTSGICGWRTWNTWNIWCTKITRNQRTPCMAPKINCFFSSFFLQEYGRLEKIRFNRTQPKIHVSADAEKSHHISHISKYVPHSTEYTQSYPTISLPPNISNYILQYPYSISIVSQNIPILSPKYPISIYFEG